MWSLNILSLFSNVGFGEALLNKSEFKVLFSNEIEENRCDLYKKLHPQSSCICGDIADYKIRSNLVNQCLNHSEKIDLVIATPPCQGMSAANALKTPNDSRNLLIVYALEIFNSINAKYMLIENVPQMPKTYINRNNCVVKISDYIKSAIPKEMEAIFYTLDSKNFGIPQSRKRSICLISKSGEWKAPEFSKKSVTLRDAIGHLPSLGNGEASDLPWHFSPNHNSNHVRWMSATPEGQTAFNNKVEYPKKDGRKIKGFMTTYKRMYWDKPASTVTMTNGSISSQNNVHPSDPRVLSIRELLCVCGLPENYLDKFAHFENGNSFSYDYKPSFIRKVIGEIFLPQMCLSLLQSLPKNEK